MREGRGEGFADRTLIDELLAEQQRLTAVERFAQRHAANGAPAQAKFYRDLIPLDKPKPGEQYAFEVDLDKCSGCKACVSACHSLNGLDDGETWRSVGLLISGSNDECRMTNTKRSPKLEARKSDFDIRNSFVIRHSSFGFLQHITTACHHCLDPGCLNGCPVLAYDKDPLTGIVRHLDDQCIGCQYCVMKCPYEVPQYSKSRGIVRKCDMCHDRLAVGEAPACVQACPHEAIRIALVETNRVHNRYRGEAAGGKVGKWESGTNLSSHALTFSPAHFLPDSPNPNITLPTTRYKSSKPLPANLLAGDHTNVRPADSHLPLVFMLVLTQLAVGACAAAAVANPAKPLLLVALAVSAVGLGIASLHLGKPLKAWRAFLGWRKSWFSREVIVFSAFVALAATAVFAPEQSTVAIPMRIAAALTGLLGVACSAMIYADTHREFWNATRTFGKFFGTTVVLGAATMLTAQSLTGPPTGHFLVPALAVLVVATVAKLGFEHRIFNHYVDENTVLLTPLNRTARLLDGRLGLVARLRNVLGLAGGFVLPLLILANRADGSSSLPALAITSLALCIAGELLERYLFFTAVSPARMPGGVAA